MFLLKSRILEKSLAGGAGVAGGAAGAADAAGAAGAAGGAGAGDAVGRCSLTMMAGILGGD